MIPDGTVVKPGQELIAKCGGTHGEKSIVKVKRVTPKGRIIVDHDSREITFYPNGVEFGGGKWNKLYLSLPTPEELKEVMRKSNLRIIKEYNPNDLDDDQLARIVEILNEKASE